jgi:pimeloyl-ACP methyl ester carboxylesterase
MKSRTSCMITITLFAALAAQLSFPRSANAEARVTTYTGTLADGATYLIEVPQKWSGTLLLWSHGYQLPGGPPVAEDSVDPVTRKYLLTHGYALAGSSYATTGWAIHEALPDQIAALDTFSSLVGQPTRTIAWGQSLGGMVTAGLVQNYPGRFAGAMCMCGILGGAVGTWNEFLDEGFAFTTLIAPGAALQIVNITNPDANLNLAQQLVGNAQATPQGRARIALVAALYDSPRWSDPLSPEPAATDYETQEANQFVAVQQEYFLFIFSLRTDIEARAGGNPSWNTGVHYRELLERSVDYAEVRALYKRAGLSLDADLDTLDGAPRVAADPQALEYLSQNITFNGDIDIPVLTLHTTGDELVPVENEQPYGAVARRGGDRSLLRQRFVHRGGHCNFTVAEDITALQMLIVRLDSGKWPDSDPEDMNSAAEALGPSLNVLPQPPPQLLILPAFVRFRPAPFLRRFDAGFREY